MKHLCPECDTVSIDTAEQKGAIHLDCPVCLSGSVFRDARGGYECRFLDRGCDTGSPAPFGGRPGCGQRFLVHAEPAHGYGGPPHVGGPLSWRELPLPGWASLALLLLFVLALFLVPTPGWAAVVLFGRLLWDSFRHRWHR